MVEDAEKGRAQGVGKVINQGSDLRRCNCGDDAVGCPMCLCRWQRDRRDALTWQGTERSPCRQGATRAAQGPDPGLCLPSPQVRPHVTDFADPLARDQNPDSHRDDHDRERSGLAMHEVVSMEGPVMGSGVRGNILD